jgi:hypothetical protein
LSPAEDDKNKRDNIGPNHLSGKNPFSKKEEIPASIDESISKEKKKEPDKTKTKFFFELNSFLEEQMSTFSPLLLLLLLLHTTTI